MAPCRRRGGRIRTDDLALEPRVQQVLIAVDLDTKLRRQVGVDNQVDQLDVRVVVEPVVRPVLLVQLLVQRGDIWLEQVRIGVSVTLAEPAPHHVSLRIPRLARNPGTKLAGRPVDHLDVDAICFLESADNHLDVRVGLGGIDHQFLAKAVGCGSSIQSRFLAPLPKRGTAKGHHCHESNQFPTHDRISFCIDVVLL